MAVTDELTPIEVLYLCDREGKEVMDIEHSLTAILIRLASEGYIQPQDEKFQLTYKGRNEREGLRPYEVKCLHAIENNHKEGLLEAFNSFDFRELMTEKGFFKIEEKLKRKLWFIEWIDQIHVPTEKYHQALTELDGLKKQISTAASQKSRDSRLISMSYAFPSSGLSDGFLAYTTDLADALYACQTLIKTIIRDRKTKSDAAYVATICATA